MYLVQNEWLELNGEKIRILSEDNVDGTKLLRTKSKQEHSLNQGLMGKMEVVFGIVWEEMSTNLICLETS